jgi:Flp pilus assembly protein TadD/cell division septation protein DedD
MNSRFVIKLALSIACVAVPAMTASAAGTGSTANFSVHRASPQKAFAWAKTAERALRQGKADKALAFAERAVHADMQNRDYRGLLARVYMANGRFASAERTLMDVMELGQVDSRTVISLALARIALGNTESAVLLVDSNRSILPVSDYALTLALAGRSADAVKILTDAVRTEHATSRIRQNLALAYALDGRWRDARIMASQDMPQERVNERIAEWAQLARPGAYTSRVAGLLKVRPDMSDRGQPLQLALNSFDSVGFAKADLAPTVAPEFADVAPAPAAELAAIGPAPVSESAGFAPVENFVKFADATPKRPAYEAPLIKASQVPAKSAAVPPVKLALADVSAKTPAVAGSYLVQLGAFSSVANAQAAWNKYAKRYGALNGFEFASSTLMVNGRKLIRLAAMGFGNAASANATCKMIKSQGGDCFVRTNGGLQNIRMANAAGRKIAAR